MKKSGIVAFLLVLLLTSLLFSCTKDSTENETTQPSETNIASPSTDFAPSVSLSESADSEISAPITDIENPEETEENGTKYPTLKKQYWDGDRSRPFASDTVCLRMQPSKKNLRDYAVSDFPELDLADVWYTNRFESGPCLILTLKNPSEENVISAIKTLEQREDTYTVMPEYDVPLVPVEIPEDATYYHDQIVTVIQPSARQKTYTIADFPELECLSVKELVTGPIKSVTVTLKQTSKESVIAAVRLLEGRKDLMEVRPAWYVIGTDGTVDGFPDENVYP